MYAEYTDVRFTKSLIVLRSGIQIIHTFFYFTPTQKDTNFNIHHNKTIVNEPDKLYHIIKLNLYEPAS